MEHLLTANGLLSLLSLTVLEIILGVDNIIFISIVAAKLPSNQQNSARKIGLFLAMIVRIGLLFCISWIVGLKADLFSVAGYGFSGRDLILLFGGLFLVAKTVSEIHGKLEGAEEHNPNAKAESFASTLVQIVLIDIIFSFDSILTAVGLTNQFEVMVLAVVISMTIMMIYARHISIFINRRPTLKMLALCFLIMIGVLLVAEAFDVHVPKLMVYFGMAFALAVELLNQKMRKKARPVKLRGTLKPLKLEDSEG